MQVLNTSLFEKSMASDRPNRTVRKLLSDCYGFRRTRRANPQTDQDNALILGEGADPEAARIAADEFSATLTRLGYPPCKGKIMVNNPEWRKPLARFKEMIFQWCTKPNPDALMNLAIFMTPNRLRATAHY